MKLSKILAAVLTAVALGGCANLPPHDYVSRPGMTMAQYTAANAACHKAAFTNSAAIKAGLLTPDTGMNWKKADACMRAHGFELLPAGKWRTPSGRSWALSDKIVWDCYSKPEPAADACMLAHGYTVR